MFIAVSSFRARPGEEDAVVALHEDWVRSLRPRADGFVRGELLVGGEATSTFVRILRFQDEAAARKNAGDPEQLAWFRRLASLAAGEVQTGPFRIAWSADGSDPADPHAARSGFTSGGAPSGPALRRSP